jgi:ferredoxin
MDKVDLPWHKHAIVKNPATCIGCLKCSKLCETGAITSKKSSQGKVRGDYTPFAKMVYVTLLLSTMALIFTGLSIQIGYHMGNHGHIEVNDTFIGMGYHTWSLMHKTISAIFAVMVTVHIYLQRKFLKHNRKTAIILILTITALTGFLAWCCSFSESTMFVRKALIEIHDKITLILFLVMIVHLLRHDHIIWPWR